MGKPTGFIEWPRLLPKKRAVTERLRDWREVETPLGRRVLDNWEHLVSRFVKVMPVDYKRVLQAHRAASRPRPGHLSVVGGGR